MTVLDEGALHVDLTGHRGDQVTSYTVRLDLEKDGTLRNRVWSVNSAERTLVFDVHHQKLTPEKQ